MIFQWPFALVLLAIVPILIGVYLLVLRRKRAITLRYAAWKTPSGDGISVTRLRRHLPPVLFLIAVVALIGAMARPSAVLSLPSHRDVVILAVDVSGSMRATDLKPSRLVAAQQVAKEFITHQPRTTQIGIVAFAANALVVQRPTTNREDLLAAIDRFQTQDGTTIGGAILVSLQTLFPKENIDVPEHGARARPDRNDAEQAGPPPPPPVAPGSETSAAIVLLTDGQATTGPDPLEAARMAADHGVRVFTVGIGTKKGEVVKDQGISMRVQLDEETLNKIADATRARFFLAGANTDLREIYRELDARLVTETQEIEISAFFVAAAGAAALVGAALSLLWFHRIV